ncbi:MAG TPA: hypothetical protein PK784_05530 [Tenuifilaceae bacterium]|nr:hypothetical protein [Tenuifilaceae bacterium]HPN21589.1 hypothetical protein [Tenuifilaceae bacterium]
MKDILGVHLDEITSDISDYLFESIDFIKENSLFDSYNQPALDIIFGTGDKIDRLNSLLNNRIFLSNPRQDLVILAKLLVGFHLDKKYLVENALQDLMNCQIAPRLALKIDLLIKLSKVLYLNQNDYFVANLESLMSVLPQDIQPAKIVEKYYLLHGRGIRAKVNLIEMIEHIVRYRDDNLECLLLIGNMFKKRNSIDIAIDVYLKCITICQNKSLFTELSQICLDISRCYLQLKNPEKAVDYSSISIKLFEKYNADLDKTIFLHKAYSIRCEAHLLQNNLELALKDINLAIDFYRDNRSIALRESIVCLLKDLE